MRHDPIRVYRSLWARDGDVASVPWGDGRLLLLTYPEDIHRVLVANDRSYVRILEVAPGARVDLQEPNSLSGPRSDADLRLRVTRLLRPAYARRRLLAQWPQLVALADAGVREWGSSEEIDVVQEARRVAVQLSMLALTGRPLPIPVDRFIRNADAVLGMVFPATSRIRELASRLNVPKLLRADTATTEMYELVEAGLASHDGEGGDLYAAMLRVERELGLERQEVVREAVGHVIALAANAGFAVGMTLYLLERAPEAHAAARAEADALAARGCAPDDLPWIHAALAEGLRLNPPFDRLARQARGDDDLRGHPVRPGDQILISPELVHNDDRWWPEPAQFRPDRWLDGSTRDLPKCAFLAFGAGPRMCTGEYLSWLAMYATLGAALHHWNLPRTRDDQHVHPVSQRLMNFLTTPVAR